MGEHLKKLVKFCGCFFCSSLFSNHPVTPLNLILWQPVGSETNVNTCDFCHNDHYVVIKVFISYFPVRALCLLKLKWGNIYQKLELVLHGKSLTKIKFGELLYEYATISWFHPSIIVDRYNFSSPTLNSVISVNNLLRGA